MSGTFSSCFYRGICLRNFSGYQPTPVAFLTHLESFCICGAEWLSCASLIPCSSYCYHYYLYWLSSSKTCDSWLLRSLKDLVTHITIALHVPRVLYTLFPHILLSLFKEKRALDPYPLFITQQGLLSCPSPKGFWAICLFRHILTLLWFFVLYLDTVVNEHGVQNQEDLNLDSDSLFVLYGSEKFT